MAANGFRCRCIASAIVSAMIAPGGFAGRENFSAGPGVLAGCVPSTGVASSLTITATSGRIPAPAQRQRVLLLQRMQFGAIAPPVSLLCGRNRRYCRNRDRREWEDRFRTAAERRDRGGTTDPDQG